MQTKMNPSKYDTLLKRIAWSLGYNLGQKFVYRKKKYTWLKDYHRGAISEGRYLLKEMRRTKLVREEIKKGFVSATNGEKL